MSVRWHPSATRGQSSTGRDGASEAGPTSRPAQSAGVQASGALLPFLDPSPISGHSHVELHEERLLLPPGVLDGGVITAAPLNIQSPQAWLGYLIQSRPQSLEMGTAILSIS